MMLVRIHLLFYYDQKIPFHYWFMVYTWGTKLLLFKWILLQKCFWGRVMVDGEATGKRCETSKGSRCGWFSTASEAGKPLGPHFLQTPFITAPAKRWAQRGTGNCQGISSAQDFQFLRTIKLSQAALSPPCGKPGLAHFQQPARKELGWQPQACLSCTHNCVNSLHPSPSSAQSRSRAIQSCAASSGPALSSWMLEWMRWFCFCRVHNLAQCLNTFFPPGLSTFRLLTLEP